MKMARLILKSPYGYLNAGTKKLVDNIVSILAGEERIQELYGHWYDLKEDVLRTYTNKLPDRIPLEQQKEFKSIRNAVVQAALQLDLPQEETPPSSPAEPCVGVVDDGANVYPKAAESLRGPTVEPSLERASFLPKAAAYGLLKHLAGMLQTSADAHYKKRMAADRKQKSKTIEKKEAHGQHHQEEYQGQTM